MCGIAGIVDFGDPASSSREKVAGMTGLMKHRGPDATGFYANGAAALGHNRLSIIDLAACSNQPMADHSGRYHIVFNGEIYNYRELRSKLGDYPFTTNGDTETILAAYISFGADCVKEMAGMFAFAIWDEAENTLFLARDRLGVKPLYYAENNGSIVFASELRAILGTGLVKPVLDENAVSEYLQFQSITFPSTIISGISSVEAGTWMKLSKYEKIINKYWSFYNKEEDFDYNDEVAVRKRVCYLLEQSVSRRMVSDVPVAAFLSGGIDSSAVVALMSRQSSVKVNTFNVGFEEKEYDESGYASLVAKRFGTAHQQIRLKANNLLDELKPALLAMDSPSGDGINSFVVSKAISTHGIKVALSGTGGDELFAGYPFFNYYARLMKLQPVWSAAYPLRRMAAMFTPQRSGRLERYADLLKTKHAGIAEFYPAFRQVVSAKTVAACTSLPVQTGYPSNGSLYQDAALVQLPLLSQVSVAEYAGYTQHTLLRDIDQMSMATSLEVREPFFDHELINFVLQVPDKIKYPAYPKKLLVESLGDLVPAEVIHRKKQGFEFPWKMWMKKELRSFCDLHLQAMSQRSFIKGDALMYHWQRFLQNDPSVRWMELWLFVVLENWLEKNNVR